MTFRTMASIDSNQHKGLILLNSITGNPMAATGLSLTNAQPMHVAVVDTSGSQVVPATGGKSNNAVVPGSTNAGVLPAIATAAAPSYTEGFQVGLSTDLSGALRISGSISVGGTTDNSAFTAGTSTGTPALGFYHSTIDTVTDGRAATIAITSKRAMMVNLQTSTGAETGIAALPLQVSLANTAANATAVKVDGSAVTQPVSGTVAVSSITTSIVPGVAATNLGKAEDAAHTTGDTGVFMLGVRNDDGATAGSGTNGDYTQMSVDVNGRSIVTSKAKTGTEISVAGNASSVTILAANTDRLGASVYNDSTAILYLRYSATAATSSAFTVKLFPEDYHEIFGGYTGQLTGIWASAAGNARITELSS